MRVLDHVKKLMVSAMLVLTVAIATSGLGLFTSGPAQAGLLQPVFLVGSDAAGQIELERAKDEFQDKASPAVQRAIADPQGKVERDIDRVQNKVERDVDRVQNKVERDIDRTQDKVERDIDRTQDAAEDAAEDAKSGILNFFNK